MAGFCKPCKRCDDARKLDYICVRNIVEHNSPN